MSDRRDRGSTSIFFVVLLAVLLSSLVLGSETTIGTFAREVRREGPSDQAFALAEAGLVAARARLEKEGAFAGLSGARLGPGRIDVTVSREGADVVVVSTGTVDQGPQVRPGEKVARRVRARLRAGEKGLVVVEWREL